MGAIYEPIFKTKMDNLFDLDCCYNLNRPRHTVTIYNNQFTHREEAEFVFLITYNPVNQKPMMVVVQSVNGQPIPEFSIDGYVTSYKSSDCSSITYLPEEWAERFHEQDQKYN